MDVDRPLSPLEKCIFRSPAFQVSFETARTSLRNRADVAHKRTRGLRAFVFDVEITLQTVVIQSGVQQTRAHVDDQKFGT